MSTPDRCRERCPVGVLRCACLLFVVKQALRVRGFAWTMSWIMKPGPATSSLVTDTRHLVEAVERRVAMAAAFYPGRARCLEQSMVLFYLLRRRGIEATLALGVQAHPFLAHAWLEHEGRVVNDVLEHVNWFARFPVEFR